MARISLPRSVAASRNGAADGAADGGGDVGLCLNTKMTKGTDVKCNGDSGGPFFTLTVSFEGNGSGSISDHFDIVGQGDPLSFASCNTGSGPCSQRHVPNTRVELRSQADGGSRFTGLTGACGGGSTCLITMNGNKAVTATFVPQ